MALNFFFTYIYKLFQLPLYLPQLPKEEESIDIPDIKLTRTFLQLLKISNNIEKKFEKVI